MHDQVLHPRRSTSRLPLGHPPAVEEACVDHSKGSAYSAPSEDLKLEPAR